MRRLARAALLATSALVASMASASDASAFCGFYVSGADAQLFNNATLVVMMRDGTRTVLSMQNNYEGPPENFAMVVPVPVVLQKDNVKTLPREIFKHVDQLSAPRLVEYWEQDPCEVARQRAMPSAVASASGAAPGLGAGADAGVRIEAQFTVGEYDIVILSADDSTGLDRWLRENSYKIPAGAEPALRPYVEQGMKFFVAKVDTSKVTFVESPKGGKMASLSPLRFHYDTDTFALPVRLGLLNSAGTQDLIVNILAPGKRYEMANFKNVTIPTNIDVTENARKEFGAFYAALFDKTLEQNPGAVVTEYSWDAGSCDPCPSPPLTDQELASLGADVVSAPGQSFVLTRLHARYGKESLGQDLVFQQAEAVMGGREFNGPDGKLEHGSMKGSINNFQGRYAIRHPWTDPVKCDNPIRGVWGGPPNGAQYKPPEPATDLAFAPRGKLELTSFLRQDVPELKLKGVGVGPGAIPGTKTQPTAQKPKSADPTSDEPRSAPRSSQGSCWCGVTGGDDDGSLAPFLAGGAILLGWSRRKRRGA